MYLLCDKSSTQKERLFFLASDGSPRQFCLHQEIKQSKIIGLYCGQFSITKSQRLVSLFVPIKFVKS